MIEERLISKRYGFSEGTLPFSLAQTQIKARDLFLDEIHRKGRYVRLGACPYCGYGSFKIVSRIERRGLPSDIVICDSCDGCFKAAIMDQDASRFHYNNVSYLLRGKDPGPGAMDRLFRERVERFAYPKYYFISHFLDLEPGEDLIAELGCNDGANLFPWKENGFEVAGIDLDEDRAAYGRKLGIDVTSGDFMGKWDLAKKPKLLILSHLLEHVADAGLALERARELIGPDGYLFIESPGIRVHGLRHTMAYFDVEHNYNFEKESLARLLEERSFRIIYADEYARFICAPRENSKARPPRRIQLSPDIVIAGILSCLIKLMGTQGMKLADVLKRSERNSLRIIVLNKLQNEYFKRYYSAIVRSEAGC